MKRKKLLNVSSLTKSLLLLFAMLYMQMANGQSRNRLSVLVENTRLKEAFVSSQLFTVNQNEQFKEFAKDGASLTLSNAGLSQLMQQKNNALHLIIPSASGKTYELDVVKVDLAGADFKVGTKGEHAVNDINYQNGLHYRGIIKGDNNSLAAVSLFNNEVMIMFANSGGNFVLGKMRDNSGNYFLYNDKDALNPPATECATDYNLPYEPLNNSNKNGWNSVSAINCKVVHCYYECDYAMYQAFGSNTTTTANYVTGAFNEKATLYANEGITVEISQIYVWTSTDPEAGFTSTSTVNNQFISSTGSTFNGDMAQFLTTRSLGGGIAQGFSGLCNKSQAHSTCQVYTTYSTYPTYSWTIEVMTHEMGHLLGSRHTHACVWNGNNTAIDGCAGATEGGCPLPGNPPGGGTIMSYCHLVTSVGINFTLGFGPQPGALILGNVNSATCLTGSSAATPTGLSTTAITTTSATLNWNASSGASQYTVEYKASSGSIWISLGNFTGTTANLTGLTINTSYDWHVNADCSPFSSTATFNTSVLSGCGVPTGLFTNNISSNTARLNWTAFSGAAKYKTRYRVKGTTAWTITNLSPAYQVLAGLTPATKYEWNVKSKCGSTWTTWSVKIKFTTTGTAPPPGYCTSSGQNTTYEYINSIQAGGISNTSGDNGGYADYTSQSTSAGSGAAVNLSVSLSKSISTDVEYVSVFVDFNRDGDFDDAGELAYSANGSQSTFTGSFSIPVTASIGQTRMRISMQYNAAPATCGTFTYGEVEDYILNITNSLPISSRSITDADDQKAGEIIIAPNPASDKMNVTIDDDDVNYTLQIYSATGQLVKTIWFGSNTGTIDISDLAKGVYHLIVTSEGLNRMNKTFVKN